LRAKRTKEVSMDEKPTWNPTRHKWLMSHGLPDFASSSGFNTRPVDHDSSKSCPHQWYDNEIGFG
jgi:hypothetical protein